MSPELFWLTELLRARTADARWLDKTITKDLTTCEREEAGGGFTVPPSSAEHVSTNFSAASPKEVVGTAQLAG